MRKFIITVSLLLAVLLSIGFMCYAFVDINSAKDKLELFEETVYGDKNAVDGLQLRYTNVYASLIYWKSCITLGTENIINTEFYYGSLPEMPQSNSAYSRSSSLYMTIFVGYGEEQNEVKAITGPGETKSKIIKVKDYYEYYPIEVDLFVADGIPNSSGAVVDTENSSDAVKYAEKKLGEFLKIPVLSTEEVEITVSRGADGKTGSTTADRVRKNGNFELMYEYVFTKNAMFLVFDAHTLNGNLLNTSCIPGGYGIYCLPYSEDGKEIYADEIANVFPLDPTVKLRELYESEDGKYLYLYTIENGGYYLTVIELSTMECTSKVELVDEVMPDYYYSEEIRDEGDHIIFTVSNFFVAVVSLNDGVATLKESINFYEYNGLPEETVQKYFLNNGVFEVGYNEDTLVLLGGNNHGDGGFYIAAFTKDRCVYLGEYQTASSKANYGVNYRNSRYFRFELAELDLVRSS